MIVTIPIISAIVFSIVVIIFRKSFLNRVAPVVYSFIHAGVSLYNVSNPGTAGVYFESDKLNTWFLLVLSVVLVASALYNFTYMKNNAAGRRGAIYASLLMIFGAAMTGVTMSADLGMMWVCVEATTIASAYLINFNEGKHSLEAAWKYIFVCSIGIAFAFLGIIFLSLSASGMIESLRFSELINNAAGFDRTWLKIAFVLMAVGFGTKAGLAPMHAWLPDAHSEAPSPVSAMLSAGLLNAAMLGLMKIHQIMKAAGLGPVSGGFYIFMGMVSLFVAAVYMIRVRNYKRMFAYSSIENMGIIAIGAGLGGYAALAAVLHTAVHSLAKTSLFLTAGNILKRYKTKEISKITGLFKSDNKSAWLLIAGFVIISAIPPSPAFISEFIIIKVMLESKMYVVAFLMLLFLTVIVFGMGKSVFSMVTGKNIEEKVDEKFGILMYLPQIIIVVVLLIAGLYIPEIITELMRAASAAM